MAIKNSEFVDPVVSERGFGLWNSLRHFAWNYAIPEAVGDDVARLAEFASSVPRSPGLMRVIAEQEAGQWMPRFTVMNGEVTAMVQERVVTYSRARRLNKWNNPNHRPDFSDRDCASVTVDLDDDVRRVVHIRGIALKEADLLDDVPIGYREYAARHRLHQQELRRRTLEIHGEACCYCGLDIPEVIQAAHIDADSEGGRANVENMRPLCANHHLAYDRGLMDWDPACNEFVLTNPDRPVPPFPQ